MRISLTPIFWDKPDGRNIKSLKIILSVIDDRDTFDKERAKEKLVKEFKITPKSSQALLSILSALGFHFRDIQEIRDLKAKFDANNQEAYTSEIINKFQENLLGFSELLSIITEMEIDEKIELNRMLQKWVAQLPKEHRDKKNHKYQLISRIAWLIDLGIIVKLSEEGKIFYKKEQVIKRKATLKSSLKSELIALSNKQRNEVIEHTLDYLLSLNPVDFEFLVGILLESLGYKIEITRYVKDGGIDIEAIYDNTLQKTKTAIQVKRYKRSNKISRTVIDQLRGSLHRVSASQGIVVTTSDFTKDAFEAANEFGAPPISLINGKKLVQILAEQNLGIETNEVQLWEFNQEFFINQLFSEEDEKMLEGCEDLYLNNQDE